LAYSDHIKQRAFQLWQIGYFAPTITNILREEHSNEAGRITRQTVDGWVTQFETTIEGRMSHIASKGFEEFYNNIQDKLRGQVTELENQLVDENEPEKKREIMRDIRAVLKDIYIIMGDGQLVNALRALRARQLVEQSKSA
jgi:thiamine pyrophosphate-dependent acetolactate synthase large subunit-like protein